jgi:carbamoyl-phosphate synthase large subunit
MNILLTSAGRRTSLTVAFQEAARPMGLKVLAADFDPLAPALLLADGAFQVPKVTGPAYVATLLAISREQGVSLIVPTIDTELPILASQQEAFLAEGIRVVISTPGFVALCRDKWVTFQALRAEGIAVPASWLPGALGPGLPDRVFLKPRNGSASLNAYPCSRADLARMLPLVPDAIVQECLEGPEITIDALLDFAGRPLHFVPRERIRTLGGESIQGFTLDRPEVDPWCGLVLAACGRLGARGPITLQAFLTARGPVLTEINARFGGGFPLARAAGGDYPAWILALHRGAALQPSLGQYRRGLYMTRYYSQVFLNHLPWPLAPNPAEPAAPRPAMAPVADATPPPYQLLTTRDAQAWRAALPMERFVLGALEFNRIQERFLRGSARLFVLGSGPSRMAYPFFIRPIPPHPALFDQERWDIATSEYSGPVFPGAGPGTQAPAQAAHFRTVFNQFCRSEGIVAEFAHLNPWHAQIQGFDPAGIELDREIIYVDLTLGEADLWQHSLTSDARRQTRQAIESGVRVRCADSEQDVLAFHRLHQLTMGRLAARDRYFLPPEYFLAIFEAMPGNALFMLSEYQGRIVAGGLYFMDNHDVYWHLSALDIEFAKVRPVNAFHYETILRTARSGRQRMLCGGGHQTGDGVFRFKAGFSPLRVPFNTFKGVHDRELYALLTAEWSLHREGLPPKHGFFPAYRSEEVELDLARP